MMFYEVWDDESGNRVGPSFATQPEAEALLSDVLRVNGAGAVRKVAVLGCRRNAAGEMERVTVLEGADFVARAAVA